MASLTVVRSIRAPVEVVFRNIADHRRFGEAVGGVTHFDFLSPMEMGLGTRFRQTRTMNGQTTTMDFEVTEFVENKRIRIVNETHGTVWDSVFDLEPADDGSTLTMRMETKSRSLLPKILLPIMIPLFIKRAVEKDVDALKAYCERPGS